MECELCFENYDSEEHIPLRLFCCKKTLCRQCIVNISNTTSMCPWDKKRWVARSALKKCESITPPNYLEGLRLESLDNNDSVLYPAPVELGDGNLADEYEKMLAKRLAEDAEQIANDIQLARQLSSQEEQAAAQAREDQARRDEAFARIIADMIPPIPPPPDIDDFGSGESDSTLVDMVELEGSPADMTSPPKLILDGTPQSITNDPFSSSDGWVSKAPTSGAPKPKAQSGAKNLHLPPSSLATKKAPPSSSSSSGNRSSVDIRSFLSVPSTSIKKQTRRPIAVGEAGDTLCTLTGRKRRIDPEVDSHVVSCAAPRRRGGNKLENSSLGGGSMESDVQSVIEIVDEASNASSAPPPEWSCPKCTFWNCGHLSVCEMCHSSAGTVVDYDIVTGGSAPTRPPCNSSNSV